MRDDLIADHPHAKAPAAARAPLKGAEFEQAEKKPEVGGAGGLPRRRLGDAGAGGASARAETLAPPTWQEFCRTATAGEELLGAAAARADLLIAVARAKSGLAMATAAEPL